MLGIAFILIAALGGAPSHAASPIPAMPPLYVLDEAKSLTQDQSRALSALLIEHDRVAGEQIAVAILRSAEGEDPDKRAQQIFEAWDVSRRVGGNGALLAVFLREQEARIEVGYGMSTRLTDAEAKRALRDFLLPELREGRLYRALGLGTLEMLRSLESPLIESGRALEVLRAGGLEGALKPVTKSRGGWLAWVLLGLAVLTYSVLQLLAAEAHFTSEGWFRPKPWKHLLARRGANASNVGGAFGDW
jgi:uncharacterized membrane protein YgcG